MQTKQTAVEWLVEQLTPAISLQQKYIDEIKQQAKQMEKDQMIQFADEYADAVMGGCINRAEQYYNETYGKD